MTDLIELAARVDGLSGPDREVDAMIVTTLCPGSTVSEYMKGEGDDIVFHAEAMGIRNKSVCPWYTHSLDAAMTLVLEDCFWQVGHDGEGADPSDFLARVFNPITMKLPATAIAATPALALTAAALRARATQ